MFGMTLLVAAIVLADLHPGHRNGIFVAPHVLIGNEGSVDSRVAIRVLPGDAPVCFDVAVGPLVSGVEGVDPSQLAITWQIQTDLAGRGSGDVEPLQTSSVNWAAATESTHAPDVEAYRAGTHWAMGMMCLNEPPAGRYRLTAVLQVGAVVAPSAEPQLKSRPLLIEHGPQVPMTRDRSELISRYYRAFRFARPVDALEPATLLIEMYPEEPCWHGWRGDALAAVGRVAEARTEHERAVTGCIADEKQRRERGPRDLTTGAATDAGHGTLRRGGDWVARATSTFSPGEV